MPQRNPLFEQVITPEKRAAYQKLLKEALAERRVTDKIVSVEEVRFGTTQVLEFEVSPAAQIYQ